MLWPALGLSLLMAAPAAPMPKDAPPATVVKPVDSAPALAAARAGAEKLAKALLHCEYEAFADLTFAKALALNGGRAGMIATLKSEMAKMKDQGISFRSVEIGDPHSLQPAGKLLLALVPQTIVLAVPDGQLTQQSNLLAVSGDRGASWTFFDVGNIDATQAKIVVPELPDSFKLPARPEPVFTPNP